MVFEGQKLKMLYNFLYFTHVSVQNYPLDYKNEINGSTLKNEIKTENFILS